MATHRKQWIIDASGANLNYSKTYTNNGSVRIDGETVADSVTDQLYTIAIDVSAVTSFFMVADGGALTVETNAVDATGGNTIALVDGVPYEWDSDSYDSFLLTLDVTKLYLTNASGATVTVYLECLYDGSP